MAIHRLDRGDDTVITLALVEDDEAHRTELCLVVERFFAQNGEEIQLLTYTDGDDILARYPQHLDLILMDIDMPRINGLEAARRIRSFDTQVLLIFVTNMVQCALEGYAVEAMDFIVKPVTDYSCQLSFSRVLRRLRQRRGRSIQVRRGKNTYSINASELQYAETEGHSLLLHMKDGSTISITESIQSLTQRTQHLGLFRCHTSFLVNLAAVDTIRRTDTVVGGVVLPVSKHRREEFLRAMAGYTGGAL